MSEASVTPLMLIVYGDSLSLPRARVGVNCGMTYADGVWKGLESIHKGRPVYLYNRSIGGSAISFLHLIFRKDREHLDNVAEKLTVIQCGIVDCAPRPLSASVRNALSKFPLFIRRRIVGFLHHNRKKLFQKGIFWRYTSPREFYRQYCNWIDNALSGSLRIYAINIFPTNDSIESRSPGLQKSIEAYNGLIRRACSRPECSGRVFLIDGYRMAMGEGADRFVYPQDGHHITPLAHEKLANAILDNERSLVRQ